MFKKKSKFGGNRFQKLATPGKGWRGYQKNIKLHDEKKVSLRRIRWYFLALVILGVLIQGGFYVLEKRMARPLPVVSIYPPGVEPLEHEGLKNLLASWDSTSLNRIDFSIPSGTDTYQILTSIDEELQNSIISSLDIRHANRIGIVALEPDTGRILAMVSHNSDAPSVNACLTADLPAASIFKIITASAALEAGRLPDLKKLAFNGGKFTLYRNQLTDKVNRYTNHVSLEAAFAESINPVFGKLGKNVLGRDLLMDYAHAYHFNHIIDFDLPVEESFLEITEKPYNWAEIACGFNRTTKMSPLHAAMITGTMVNGGKIMRPAIVDVAARNDKAVYRRKTAVLSQAVEPSTVDSLRKLMNATLHYGTARAQFAGISRDPILSKLEMGGKTGSLNNNARQIRYDWFAGYAEDPEGSGKIAIGVIVAHKDYIGKRAATYFRQAVSGYFENRIK